MLIVLGDIKREFDNDVSKDDVVMRTMVEYLNLNRTVFVNFKLKGYAEFVKDYLSMKEVFQDGNRLSLIYKNKGAACAWRFGALSKYMKRFTLVQG